MARLVADTIAIAAQIGDYSMFGLLPPLEPFFPLSPVIKRLETVSVPASKCVIAGRYELGRELYKESLASLMIPGHLDEALRMWSIRALHYAIGSIEAGLGREPALRHAEELEQAAGWEVPAWTVRLSYHLTIGNLREAERCRSQIELLMLQSPVKPQLWPAPFTSTCSRSRCPTISPACGAPYPRWRSWRAPIRRSRRSCRSRVPSTLAFAATTTRPLRASTKCCA